MRSSRRMMMGGLQDRRPATASSKGKLTRLLCCRTGGVDHPGARGGGVRGKEARGRGGEEKKQEEEEEEEKKRRSKEK